MKNPFEQVKMRVKPGPPGKDRMTRSLHIEVDNGNGNGNVWS